MALVLLGQTKRKKKSSNSPTIVARVANYYNREQQSYSLCNRILHNFTTFFKPQIENQNENISFTGPMKRA